MTLLLYVTDPCPHGTFTLAANNRCYTYSYEIAYTWAEAKEYCRTKGGYLLSTETVKEFVEFLNWYLRGKCVKGTKVGTSRVSIPFACKSPLTKMSITTNGDGVCHFDDHQ